MFYNFFTMFYAMVVPLLIQRQMMCKNFDLLKHVSCSKYDNLKMVYVPAHCEDQNRALAAFKAVFGLKNTCFSTVFEDL